MKVLNVIPNLHQTELHFLTAQIFQTKQLNMKIQHHFIIEKEAFIEQGVKHHLMVKKRTKSNSNGLMADIIQFYTDPSVLGYENNQDSKVM